MTKKVAGTSLSAPAIPAAANGAPKEAAVEAATIPRGSIQPMNARSRTDSGVLNVETAATNGRTTSTSPSEEHQSRSEHRTHRRRRHGGRDGDEQDPDDELDDCREELSVLRQVDAGQVGQCHAHDDGGDQAGVGAGGIAESGRADDHGQNRLGGEHAAEPELAQEQPQHRRPDDAAERPDPDAAQEGENLPPVARSATWLTMA